MSQFTKKWWFKWLLIGILVRLILMPLTYHPDLLGHSSVAYFFAYQGVLDPYDYLTKLSQEHPLVKNLGVGDVFIYPPLSYFTLGAFRFLLKPLSDPNLIPWLWSNLDKIYQYKSLFWHLFLFKLPYLFFDIGLAFLLANLFDDKKKRLPFILWMFNPLTLYSTFMIGQLDLLPTFFSVLCLYLIKKKKYAWAMISLGVGGSYKLFPLLFVVPAALFLQRNFLKRVKLAFLGFLPFILSILPFLGSAAFRQMVLFAPKSQKMLFMSLPVSGAEGIYPFILILAFIYSYFFFGKELSLEKGFILILLLIFSVTHYHPQWFLWVTPFLIWELTKNSFQHLPLVLVFLASWLIVTLFFEPSLSLGLFGPIWPELNKFPGLSLLIGKYTNIFQFKSLVRSVFAGASLFYVYSLFKNKDASELKT